MREILFRAKRVDNGKWVRGNLIDNECCKKPIIVEVDYLNEYGDFGEVSHEVDEKTVGQYIGLTDKNGKKIFEGDIIACTNYDEELVVEGVVKYGNFNCSCCDGVYGWYIDGGDIRRLGDWMMDDSNAEVIGNIHDNPELLEESDNGD